MSIEQSIPSGTGRLVKMAVAGILGLSVISGSFFIVDPTDMAGVRRMGSVITKEPLEPGVHFKVPFIDTVDALQVSMATFPIKDLTVYTVDNQWVKIGLNMNYVVPKSAVLHLLYEVGKPGTFGINDNIYPVISDRALRIFSKRNTVKISEERDQIANEIRQTVHERLKEMFGIDVVDLQITHIEYSPTFSASVEQAVRAKNDAIAAENTVNKIKYEGEQKKVAAEAMAISVVTAAEAEKKVKVLQAEAEAAQIKLAGEAQGEAIRARAKALADNPRLVDLTIAERWDGRLPQTIMGGNGALPLLNMNMKTGQTPN
jgi:regulator of protease activity HflC (stomatin/prohibitin superfamily)